MRVCSLIHISTPQSFDNCTLMVKSARVGFPTAKLDFWLNPTEHYRWTDVEQMVAAVGGSLIYHPHIIHHADWIKQRVDETEGKLIIVDPDVHFWQSCEAWDFPSLLAGYYIPEMWNDSTDCRSVERLHTSLLWIKDTAALRAKVKELYPLCHDLRAAPFCSCDPYTPAVKFYRGEPVFWDTCANLYHMVGGTKFVKEHWSCYDHLSSASFYDLIKEYLGPREHELWRWMHTEGSKNLDVVRRISWPMTEIYIAEKVAQGKTIKRKICSI